MSRMKSDRATVGESVIGCASCYPRGGVAHSRDAPHSRGSWLARQDSNLEPPDPESGALPLSHAPAAVGHSSAPRRRPPLPQRGMVRVWRGVARPGALRDIELAGLEVDLQGTRRV